uniref:Uncharacterized protein n=1 Tax=Rhizophora mucronata TaxID=61149 RepID=A0A2P2LY37_RHIMU
MGKEIGPGTDPHTPVTPTQASTIQTTFGKPMKLKNNLNPTPDPY